MLVGPQQVLDPAIYSLPNVWLTGPVVSEQLPVVATWADVLVMPYTDSPVTQAMQPLKLTEYLATGKAAVLRDLLAASQWSDCCDLAGDVASFVDLALERARTGLLPAQRAVRQRLSAESWSEKAKRFEALALGNPMDMTC